MDDRQQGPDDPYQDEPQPDQPGPGEQRVQRRGWWRRLTEGPDPAELEARGISLSGLRAAAEQRGWPVADEDASLGPLLAEAPLRLTPEHRAGTVARGRVGSWDLLAFEVVYLMPRGDLTAPLFAMTAVPVPIPLPRMRVAPSRFLTHGAGGLLVLPTGDDTFDARWRVLVAEDTPEVRGLVDAPLRAALLDTPDLDEVWTAAGHLAISRVDGHHDGLIELHSGVLAAAMAGLQRAF